MSESTPANLAQRLGARFGDKIVAAHAWRGETSIDVLPENWLAIAQQLRDVEEFHFEQLIDVCGVDYLSYGQTEWDTTDVSATGFSRGVEGESAGRFDWADRPRPALQTRRFAVVVQLLSVRNNQRLRLRGYCYGLLKTPWRNIANNPGAWRSCKGLYRESSLECCPIIGYVNSHWYPIIVPIGCLETHVNLHTKVAYRVNIRLPMC